MPAALTTRFAPSPTGALHLGHAYAALVAHTLARASGGLFLVRIEDLDRARSRPAYEAAIFEDLAWLGLAPDRIMERQSARVSNYRSALARLDGMGLLYPCFCTRKEIQAEIARMSDAPQEGAEGGPPYPGTCRGLSEAERTAALEGGRAHVLRLDTNRASAGLSARGAWPRAYFEGLHGEAGARSTHVRFPDDPVLARKDEPAAYHLAVVVDDAADGVNAVTRGSDLHPATDIQVLLQALLGLPTPLYGHHALVRDAHGRRLAKRADALSLRTLREGGASPADVLARLPPVPDLRPLLARAGEGLTSR